MNSFKLDYIDSIARSFLDTRVNPDKYDLYLNMFFDQSIYSSFASMGNEVSVRAMERIIGSISFEELTSGNYDAAHDIITNYRSSLFLNLSTNPNSFKDLYLHIEGRIFMRGIFNMEGPVMNFITKITYSAYLNILWLVCCLPIFTIGASTTALFYVTLKVVKNEENSLTKAFFPLI